ncbi:MAG: DUF6174 domain-containing protein [Actinomycetota bacterium]
MAGSTGPVGEVELRDAMRLWAEDGPPSYRMSIAVHSTWGGSRTYDVLVRDAAIASVEPVGFGEVQPLDEPLLTVPDLFDQAARLWVGQNNTTVRFDPLLGYIYRVEHDPPVDDGFFSLDVTYFEAIAEDGGG